MGERGKFVMAILHWKQGLLCDKLADSFTILGHIDCNLNHFNGHKTLSQTTDFKFDENGIKFFSRLENTVGKGEIAR